MNCPFVVGQKVVCITDEWRCPPNENIPRKDCIYTIREIMANDKRVGLRLKEIINQPRAWIDADGLEEGAFCASYFRPLQDRPKEAQTDISVFTPLLTAKETETQDETPVAVP